MRKTAVVLLVLAVFLMATGCSKKTVNTTNQNLKTLIQSFQQSTVTYFDIKNMQDSALLLNQVNDNFKKAENGNKKLEQIAGLTETVTDTKLRTELENFVELGRERQKLALQYLGDIRRDIEFRAKNPDTQVSINTYIINISNRMHELEYSSEQSAQRMELLFNKK